jgi:hypothetical protein
MLGDTVYASLMYMHRDIFFSSQHCRSYIFTWSNVSGYQAHIASDDMESVPRNRAMYVTICCRVDPVIFPPKKSAAIRSTSDMYVDALGLSGL